MAVGKNMSTYDVFEVYEVGVDLGEFNFLIIYGKHINGWFIAIPNWHVCTEAGCPDDEYYNASKLAFVIDDDDAATSVARVIKTHWLNVK